jgi:hypothetical protein
MALTKKKVEKQNWVRILIITFDNPLYDTVPQVPQIVVVLYFINSLVK